MLSSVYLLRYNNYYNRIIKKFDTINEYVAEANVLASFDNINFNPHDGVSTSLIINYNGADMPDYLIVVNENDVIDSRWYIIENKRNRAGQFEVSLYRDLIADWYNEIISAPMFIEKATVGLNDPAIFNNEDIAVNQIKQSEMLLKDKSRTAWYVGYYSDTELPEGSTSITVPKPGYEPSYTYNSFEEYEYHQYATDHVVNTAVPEMLCIATRDAGSSSTYYLTGYDKERNLVKPTTTKGLIDGSVITPGLGDYEGPYTNFYTGATVGYQLRTQPSIAAEAIKRGLDNNQFDWYFKAGPYLPNIRTTLIEEIEAENGKIYGFGNKTYRINVVKSNQMVNILPLTNTPLSNEIDRIMSYSDADSVINASKAKTPTCGIQYLYTTISINYVELADTTITLTMSNNRAKSVDSPYSMFAIPYDYFIAENGAETYVSKPEISRKIIDQIIINFSSALYDIQLLPFMPFDDYYINSQRHFDLSKFPKDGFTYYDDFEGSIGLIFYPYKSTFTTTNDLDTIYVPYNAIDYKISNECDLYRVCSPNYNGQFEFSPTKNGGVSGWIYTYTYKPYTPYIKVSPQFKRLYGKDFNDSRGLICGGDFSLTQIQSAWSNYELNNKNYQVMFDRQISNMEVNNSASRTRERITAATGILSGLTSGAIAASAGTGGNPYAAAAGALVGGTASAIGGIADVRINEMIRNEALDYTKDMYGYGLQNIRAMPYSLTKVGVQNYDNKLFPFVEYYTCSDVEKEALRNKIKYNGMTVMRIGKIEDYIQTERSYIKGKLIRLETIADDFHVVNMIAKELNEGVFI